MEERRLDVPSLTVVGREGELESIYFSYLELRRFFIGLWSRGLGSFLYFRGEIEVSLPLSSEEVMTSSVVATLGVIHGGHDSCRGCLAFPHDRVSNPECWASGLPSFLCSAGVL